VCADDGGGRSSPPPLHICPRSSALNRPPLLPRQRAEENEKRERRKTEHAIETPVPDILCAVETVQHHCRGPLRRVFRDTCTRVHQRIYSNFDLATTHGPLAVRPFLSDPPCPFTRTCAKTPSQVRWKRFVLNLSLSLFLSLTRSENSKESFVPSSRRTHRGKCRSEIVWLVLFNWSVITFMYGFNMRLQILHTNCFLMRRFFICVILLVSFQRSYLNSSNWFAVYLSCFLLRFL